VWELSTDRPIFQQIIERVNLDIVRKKYQPGQKLDSVRDLAAEAGVNPNTMQRALSELERNGVLYSRRGEGRFVTEDEALLKELAHSFIDGKTAEYVSFLRSLGFQDEEIMQCLRQKLEEE